MTSKTPARMLRRRAILIVVFAGVLIGALVAVPLIVQLLADWYWFSAIGFASVFLTALKTKLGLGLMVGLAAGVFFWLNLRFAQRGVAPNLVIAGIRGGAPQVDLSGLLRRLAVPASAFLGILTGLAAADQWLVVQSFRHRTPFGEVDPLFGKDVAYYVFTLPALSFIISMAIGLLVVALLMTGALYLIRRDIVTHHRRVAIAPAAAGHLGILLICLFVAGAVNVFLVRVPSMVFSTTGPLFGASYTDLAVRVPLLRALGIAALVGAGVIAWGIRARSLLRSFVTATALYVGVAVIGVLLAQTVQSLVVKPNELVKETPQLEHHIRATRTAWGLEDVAVRDLSGEAPLSLADIQANGGTLRNVRLWDREPLLQTFRQLQEIRTYYDFRAVDDDRYWIDGEYRQVLLSPRELNSASLPTRNFINERLTYTHGMGLTLSPVNQVTPQGLPVLFVKDLPPSSDVSLSITRPEIYYGEISSDYVFVNTRQREFDYPLGDTNAVTVYEGKGGVPVNSLLRKLVLSVRFRSLDILITPLITTESRVLYHRPIGERARRALPFLSWDRDPYLTITADGRLKWILDAYTTTGMYPYSLPASGRTNYMRNSVKVVIDAYDGDVRAYIADADDPLIQTYAKIFPDVFEPIDAMPADVRAHVRYPSDLFQIQTNLYTTYHMDEPEVFYAREDQWQIPSSSDNPGSSDPFLRHIIMRLPGEPTEEYIVMTPFTPRQKDNLAAWMIARNDGAHYGQLMVYRFPRQSLVFGPSQVVNRINQDTEISRQISLWDQRGSEVIRGNLLVIPIKESLLFVQALYLRAQGGRIPELKRVIVAYQDQVVMEETLGAALTRMFGGVVSDERGSVAAAAPTAAATGVGLDQQVAELVREASRRYEEAIAAQQRGDWTTYGEQMRRVRELLQRLQELVGG
ncbi:MAG TPA: UPF0182 family protein [Gemmatimonadales bacterium]